MTHLQRRQFLGGALTAGGLLAGAGARGDDAKATSDSQTKIHAGELNITGLKVTPIALPDPPLLSAGGCHGPYFLRNIVELETDAGISGIGETRGGEDITHSLEQCRELIVGESPFAYRKFAPALQRMGNSTFAAIELACLDAIGRATNRRLCEMLGGPVRESVEFASYLFFRYAADHPRVLDDERLVDERGQGDAALDPWGEVLTPAAMAEMAWKIHEKWGFRVQKLKAGVLEPDLELETMRAINDRFEGKMPLRIDPNGIWRERTALRIGRQLADLPLEYYEDPVRGQEAMARVRRYTGLPMSTNMCVTRFEHVPLAMTIRPIDIVLGDHHSFGGLTAFQTLGTICQMAGWGLSQHSNNHAGITMAAMLHAGAVVPELTYASDTHYIWLPEGADVIAGSNLPIADGRMQVPTGPGLGVELDRDKLAAAHETYEKSSMRRRDDGATMRRFQPDWQRRLY